MIFPIEFTRMRLFQIKAGDHKSHLFHLIRNLNFMEFGLVEITFRKCISKTSIKGVNYYHIEIVNRKRIRKTKEKMQALALLSSQIKSLLKVGFREENKILTMQFDEDEEFLANNQYSTSQGLNLNKTDYQNGEEGHSEDD